MRYYPVLRGKQFELLALREIANELADLGRVTPVLEPVKKRGLEAALTKMVDASMRFCVITNPIVGDFDSSQGRVELERFLSDLLGEYDNWVRLMYIDRSTTDTALSDFAVRRESGSGVFLRSDVEPRVHDIMLAMKPDCVLYKEGSVSAKVLESFSAKCLVKVADRFARPLRNADYSDFPELFSEDYFNNTGSFEGFGDYSIVGDRYSDEGGAALAVALHHVYVKDGSYGEPLYVEHFKSDSNATTADVAGKFAEALAKLVNAVPSLGSLNQTRTVEEYKQLASSEHYPGLGYAKKLAITHHLRLLSAALQ